MSRREKELTERIDALVNELDEMCARYCHEALAVRSLREKRDALQVERDALVRERDDARAALVCATLGGK